MIKNLTREDVIMTVPLPNSNEPVDIIFHAREDNDTVAHIFYDKEPAGTIEFYGLKIPKLKYTSKGVRALPAPTDGTFFIVTNEVALIHYSRPDLLVAGPEGFIRYV